MGGVNIGSHANRCIVYAVIKDESSGITQTICGGYSRFQHIYTSESNALEIRIVDLIQDDGNAPNFVIEYEGMPALIYAATLLKCQSSLDTLYDIM